MNSTFRTNTARTHIENVYEKLGVSNRIEAVNKVRAVEAAKGYRHC